LDYFPEGIVVWFLAIQLEKTKTKTKTKKNKKTFHSFKFASSGFENEPGSSVSPLEVYGRAGLPSAPENEESGICSQSQRPA